MKQIWVQCPACQTHFLVSTKHQGERIHCEQCFTNISIPSTQPKFNKFNTKLVNKNRQLQDEFFNECPFCQNIYKLLQSMAQEGVLCFSCNNIFIASSDKEDPCVTDYHTYAQSYNTRHTQDLAGFLKRNKKNNQLQGNVIANTWTLFKIAKQSMEGNWMTYLIHMSLASSTISGISYIIKAIMRIAPITFVIGAISLILINLFISNGIRFYCHNLYYSNSCVFSKFFAPYSQFTRFLTWNILVGGFLISWGLFLSIPPYFIYYLNSKNFSIFLVISLVVCILCSCIIFSMIFIKYTQSIFCLIEDNNISPWQAMKKNSEIISGNYKYLLAIPMFYFFIFLILFLIFIGIGRISFFLALLAMLIWVIVFLRTLMVYPIVFVSLYDVLKKEE